jgi:hypothetical protein
MSKDDAQKKGLRCAPKRGKRGLNLWERKEDFQISTNHILSLLLSFPFPLQTRYDDVYPLNQAVIDIRQNGTVWDKCLVQLFDIPTLSLDWCSSIKKDDTHLPSSLFNGDGKLFSNATPLLTVDVSSLLALNRGLALQWRSAHRHGDTKKKGNRWLLLVLTMDVDMVVGGTMVRSYTIHTLPISPSLYNVDRFSPMISLTFSLLS